MEAMDRRFLESLSEIYISIFACDLAANELDAIKSNPFIDRMISVPGNLQTKMDNIMGNIVVEEHLEVIKTFTDLSTLEERMKDQNIITQVFQGKMNGWCKARFIRIRTDDGAKLRYVLYTVECIDGDKKKEDQLRYQAQTDLMTGIANRGFGEKSIDGCLKSGRRGMFVLFDVDKFKRINDVYGHGVGDRVLIAIADAMREVKIGDDVVMRLGGDEFAAYFAGVEDEEKGNERITELLEKISRIRISPMEENVSVSLGAAMYEEGMDFDKAYKLADKGVYESKLNKGSSFVFCNHSKQEKLTGESHDIIKIKN